MVKKNATIVWLLGLCLNVVSQQVYYIRTQSTGTWDVLWGPDPVPGYMDAVFGAGNWSMLFYETLTPASVFACSTRMVYMEGSDHGASAMSSFLSANAALISSWVNSGGQLLINIAPTSGGNINLGFGGVLLTYSGAATSSTSATVSPGQGGHPVFNGPFASGTSWTGAPFATGTLSGGGIVSLITGNAGVVLAEKNWGNGKVLFGAITWPIAVFQAPQPDAVNLRANMLSYLDQNLVNCAAIDQVFVGTGTLCAGDQLLVSFTVTPVFFAGNVFTAQLSDASGSFATPVNIGSVVSTSDDTINAVIPDGVPYGTGYRIRVVSDNPVRTSPDNGFDITIYPKPQAAFSFSLGCEGRPVQFFDASTITSGSIVSYTYRLGDGSISNLSNPLYTYFNSGNYQVSLTVTSDAGCTGSFTQLLSVHEVPVADFTVNDNCNGQVTQFVNNSSGALFYTWKFGDGFTSGAVSPAYTYNSPGVYQVTLISENIHGCADSLQRLVTIYPKPDADFSFTSACPDVPIQFTNLTTVNGGTYTSVWNLGDGNNSNVHSPSHIYAHEGTYLVRLIVTTSYGCSDTVIRQVWVYPVPVPDFEVQSVCLGVPSVFVNNSYIASGSMTYHWFFGDGTTSGNADPVKIYHAPGVYSVTLTATSNHGCTATVVRNTQVFQQPIAGFLTANVCDGDSVNFINTTFGTYVTFQWSFGDGYFSAGANPKHLYNTPGTYTVTLISTNLNNCADTFFNQVTVYPRPAAAFNANNVCQGNSIQFHNLSTISSGTLNYIWHFGDGTTSYNPDPLKNYNQAGAYPIRLVALSDQGCMDSTEQVFSVYPQPVADFNANNVCRGDSLYFQNHSSGTITHFIWHFGDGYSDTLVHPAHLYANDGTYHVRLIAANAHCSDTIIKTVYVYARPVSAFSAHNVCAGNANIFTNQSTISNGLMNYLWHFGDGNTSINPSPVHTYLSEGIYNVSLVAYTQYGCSDTSTLQVEVYKQPIAAFDVADVCLGNAAIFQNNSVNTDDAVFIWHLGDGNISNDISLNYFYNAPGSYTVSLVVQHIDGCRDSMARRVTVYAAPVADFSVMNVCVGSPSRFINQTTITNGTLTYRWNLGDGNTVLDINPVYTYDSIGIYHVTLIATSNDGCADTATQAHVVFPVPVAAFSANVACYGQPVLFSNASDIAFGTMTYQWSFGDGSYSADNSPAHVYHSLGAFNVKLTAVSDQGCASETEQFITVYPVPAAHFITLPVCENDTVRFTNLSVISSGTLNYMWQLGDGNISQNFEPRHVYHNQSGNIYATLIATSNMGCSDTIIREVVIYPVPVAGFEYSNVCLGEPAKFTNTSAISQGSISSVFWNFGDNEVSQQYHPERIYATTGSYRVALRVVSNQGCTDSVAHVIVVYPKPDATVRALGKNPFCFGDSVILSSGTLMDSFEWSTGANTQTITVNYADYFTVTVTSKHGCKATGSINTIVYSLPSASAGSDTTISKGLSVRLNATGGWLYSWSPAETLSDAAIANPLASPPETTTYTVTVTDANGCMNTADVTVYVQEDYLLQVMNLITPNNDGANDYFEIFNIGTYPDAELLIYDRWGTELYRKKPYNNEWDGTFNGKPLPEGTYYYVIRFDGSEKLYKGSVSILR